MKINLDNIEKMMKRNCSDKKNKISLPLSDELCKAIDNARLNDPYPLPRNQWIINLIEYYLKDR